MMFTRAYTNGDTIKERLEHARQVRSISEKYGLKKIPLRQILRGHGITVDYAYRLERRVDAFMDGILWDGKNYTESLREDGNGIRIVLEAGDNCGTHYDKKARQLSDELERFASSTFPVRAIRG